MSKLPAISDPYPTLDGLYESVRSLKIAVETLAGQRGGTGSITRYNQDTEPTDQKEGDIWISTADPGKTYYWNGSYWVDISESRFKQLAEQAANNKLKEDDKQALLDDFWAELLDEHHKISEEIDAAIEESRKEFNAAVLEANTAIETVQGDVDLARDEASAALLEAKGFLQDAINGVADDTAVLSTRVDNLSAVSGGAAAAVDQEAIARAAADNALAANITTLTSTVNANKALFDNEVVTRATADSALSAQITTVSAVAGKQRVFSQDASPSSTDRIVGDIWIDTANNNRINVWDGAAWSLKEDPRIAQLNAAITSEQIARTNADTALAADITTVNASANKQRVFNQSTPPTSTGRLVGDLWFASHEGFKPYYWDGQWTDNSDNRFTTIAASVTTETAARTTADSAIGTRIDSLTSTVNGNTAAISAEQVTRANADTALSAQLTSLQSTVNTNKAAFDNEVVTRASADTALSGQITSLSTTVGTNKAALDNEIIARTNADTAISSNVSTLSTTVSGHTSSISTLSASYNGIAVKYGVQGTINGATGGFVFTGVKRNDGTGASYLLEITSNVIINGNLLVNGTVTTGKIGTEAVTAFRVDGPGPVVNGISNVGLIKRFDFTLPQAGNVLIIAATRWFYTSGPQGAKLFLWVDSALRAQGGGDAASYQEFPILMYQLYLGAGAHYVELQQNIPNNCYCSGTMISVLAGAR